LSSKSDGTVVGHGLIVTADHPHSQLPEIFLIKRNILEQLKQAQQ
jgi:hypothetical protein